MALTNIAFLRANNNELLPHIEESAMTFIFHQYAMLPRVKHFNDMVGVNTRKVSQYLPTRRASELTEATDIPDTKLDRARLNEITPVEVGEQYKISNQRIATDLEDVLSDISASLGKSVGDKIEADLFAAAQASFLGGNFGAFGSDWDLGLGIQTRMVAQQRFPQSGALNHVVHPYQLVPFLTDAVTVTNSTTVKDGLFNLSNANTAAMSFDIPQLGSIVAAPLVPRRVIFKFGMFGTAGTFRLQVGDGYVIGENITAQITASATEATLITNVDAALAALDMSSFYSGSGAFVTTGSDALDMTITPPSDMFLDDNSQLRIAIDVVTADNVTLDGNSFDVQIQKSAYDLVTTLSGSPLDMDGAELGVDIKERSGTAYGYSFFNDALVFDERGGFEVGSDLTLNQRRTFAYFISGFYGAGSWVPQHGFRVLSTANSPTAV